MKRRAVALMLAAALLGQAQAHDPSRASTLSLSLPIAVSVAAPVALLVSGATLAIVAVEASAESTLWVLERASDGARATLRLSAGEVEASAVAVGTVVVVTALSAGWVLSTAGQALCFVPNRIGQALLYDERITR